MSRCVRMRTVPHMLLVASGVFAFTSCFVAGVGAEDADPAIAPGKSLYDTVGCWSCHGYSGQGATSRGIASGPRIDARLYPREAFMHQLRSPAKLMPPYSTTVLSDEQAAAIYEFLKSLPVAPRVEDIPLLK
jgi:mono/diheme cytochrome c family protein